MTETFREITRNMQANEQHLRTNPADRGEVDNAPATVVSVILVNYKGADDTIACLDGLRALDWPRDHLEVIVVDHASNDGSVERIRDVHPEVTVLALERNTGFAAGCNHGVRQARGDYVALINNDARPDPQWLNAAVDEMTRAPDIGCVASKVLDWVGETVDFVDAARSFYGHGFKLHVGEPADDRYDGAHDVLFATGAAMVVRADVFRSAGGFDERYFMFFEDVDFGWRLWLLGWRVRFVPHSVVFHRHHASMAKFIEFCRDPQRAPDLLGLIDEIGASPRRSWKDRGGLRQDVRIVTHLFKEGGIGLAVNKAVGRARRATERGFGRTRG